MIKDNLDNASKYFLLSKNLEIGLKYLIETDFNNLEDGRYDITDEVYASVQSYETKNLEDCKFEAHKKYIDIQFIISGSEKIGVVDYDKTTNLIPYDNEKDLEFLKLEDFSSSVFETVNKNEFMILYPNDAHMPQVNSDSPQKVRKVVVKVQA